MCATAMQLQHIHFRHADARAQQVPSTVSTCILHGIGRFPLPVARGRGAADGGLGAIGALIALEILTEGTASGSACIINLGMACIFWRCVEDSLAPRLCLRRPSTAAPAR